MTASELQSETFIPPLESGDLLTHDEYVCRYGIVPDKLKAERINGKVHLMSSLRTAQSGVARASLGYWLSTFVMHDPEVLAAHDATVFLNADNDPQPDLCLLRKAGRTRFDVEGYIIGPPELIVEIAGSSASYDFGEKRDVYEAAGVGEYLVFETGEGIIRWWRSDDGKFLEIEPVEGVYRSHLFPGLWLNSDALRSANSLKLIETLQRGISES